MMDFRHAELMDTDIDATTAHAIVSEQNFVGDWCQTNRFDLPLIGNSPNC